MAKRIHTEDCYVSCDTCRVAWVVCAVPLPLDAYLRAIRKARCPVCGAGSKRLMGHSPGTRPVPELGLRLLTPL